MNLYVLQSIETYRIDRNIETFNQQIDRRISLARGMGSQKIRDQYNTI